VNPHPGTTPVEQQAGCCPYGKKRVPSNTGGTEVNYLGLNSNSNFTWSFDPSNRSSVLNGSNQSVPALDAIGAIEHKLSELMGRG
jgi:hypothetical protein